MTRSSDPRLLRRIEAMGVRATERFWGLMPPEVAKRLRPRTARMGDAFLTLAAASDALRMNRVIGLGHDGLAQEAMIDRIVAFYRAAKLRRFSVMVSPGPQAARISRWLIARGLTRHGGHCLLVREGRRTIPPVRSEVRVVRAKPEHADAILAIHERCFALPVSRRSWFRAALASSRHEQYLALVGSTPVGAGALQVDRGLAWIGGGATLTRWRRRGAHAALIAARLRRAARLGCRWMWVETAAPVPGRPAGSRRNLLRMGFEEVGVKPIFVWHER